MSMPTKYRKKGYVVFSGNQKNIDDRTYKGIGEDLEESIIYCSDLNKKYGERCVVLDNKNYKKKFFDSKERKKYEKKYKDIIW